MNKIIEESLGWDVKTWKFGLDFFSKKDKLTNQ